MNRAVEKRSYLKKDQFGIAFALIGILLCGIILVSMEAKSDPVSITVKPVAPKEDHPIFVTFLLNNPTDEEDLIKYELYSNGELLTQGVTLLQRSENRMYTYVQPGGPKLGERITFLIKTNSENGRFEKTISLPSYPPQVWSSFVSFASFSTTIMGSMGISTAISSMQFYQGTFVESSKINVGLIFSSLLIILLVFQELSEPINIKGLKLKGLKIRFGRLSLLLFIIFTGMVLTKVMIIIG